jgi:hypothetical protein
MATTYTLISSVTVGSGGAASIDFTSIPATYTDLALKLSTRSTSTDPARASVLYGFKFNNTATTYSGKTLRTQGTTVTSFGGAFYGYTAASNFTASTFDNTDIYIPNYAGSQQKSLSIDNSDEQNSANYDSILALIAGLWDGTGAINQITLTLGYGNFAQYSTAYLYGISNA